MFTIKSMNERNVIRGDKLNILQISYEYIDYAEGRYVYILSNGDNFILASTNSTTKDFDEKSEEFIKLDTLRNSILKELDDYESRAVSSESRHFKINRKFELERINL